MHYRNALIGGGLVLLSASAHAAAPAFLGTVALDLVAYTNNEGTFQWTFDGTGGTIFTYCMSTNNFIGGNPQLFDAYSIAGCTAADITSSGLLAGNSMPGLTSEHFLEAAALAEHWGTGYGITALDDLHNFQVHQVEQFGDVTWDGRDYSQFIYLKPNANNQGGGQPQGVVVGTVPEPASMAALGIGIAGFIRRRKTAKK